MPLISFIIPIYNVELYLDECIQSILKQNLVNFEIILINDGSTDKSLEICEKYSLRKEVKIVNQKNSGQSKARNVGIDLAQGTYIAFIDSDDYYINNKVKDIEKILLTEKYDLIVGKIKIFYENNKKELPKTKYKSLENINNLSGEDALEYLIKTNQFLVSPYSFIVKKDIILENKIFFNEKLRCGEDILFTPKIYLNSKKVYSYNDFFLKYRKSRPGQLTESISLEKEIQFLEILDLLNKEVETLQINVKVKKILKEYISNCYLSGLSKIVLKNKYKERKENYKKYIHLKNYTNNKRYLIFKILVNVCGIDLYLFIIKHSINILKKIRETEKSLK